VAKENMLSGKGEHAKWH